MRPIVLPVLLALTALPPVGVRAETAHPLTGDGRYQLMEVNDLIVRLDTKTGRFDLCRMEGADWSCTATRDQRVELEDRIAELTRRVEALEKDRMASAAAPVVRTPAAQAPVAVAPAPAVPAPAVPKSASPAPVVVGTLPEPRAVATPASPATVESDEFDKVADVVPPVEVGRTEGRPMVIAPVPPASEKPGLVKRITGLLPDLW